MVNQGFLSEKYEISYSLVESLFQGIAVIQNNCLVYASAGLSELSGFDSEELFRSSAEELFSHVVPECQNQVKTTFRNLADGNQAPTRIEFAFLGGDGA